MITIGDDYIHIQFLYIQVNFRNAKIKALYTTCTNEEFNNGWKQSLVSFCTYV